MSNELMTFIEYIGQSRSISKETLLKALENAILSASRKSIHPASELKIKIDPPTGTIKAWAVLEVVDHVPENSDQLVIDRARERFPDVKVGDKVEWEVTPSNFGRIAASAARQNFTQALRQAEKENIQNEFTGRIGQILYGTVRKIDNLGNVVIDFQKAEGIMPLREQIREEKYASGDHINALLVKIDANTSGPGLIVSRTAPEFVLRLFEREVSEIHDGVVTIRGIAREPGKRTKIAVESADPRVDPVGSCVGIRGARVKRITEELGTEKIDIVPYSADIAVYVSNALLPAKVQSVEVDDEKHELRVVVKEDQSKIAFGRKAQNVRLAGKLVGWTVKLCDETSTERAPSIEEQMKIAAAKLSVAAGIAEADAAKLVASGFVTVDGLKAADRETLAAVEGIDTDALFAALEKLA
ncbi:MAG: transcription termination factor NusA [Lentisphaeria bacterium]|nr:transcription termination factor NusA [Lentisphaeria bacterium]